MARTRRIYLAETRREAIAAYWRWARKWRSVPPKAVECLRRDLDEFVPFLAVPAATCFNNDPSCERMIYAVFAHLNANWRCAPLLTLHTTLGVTRSTGAFDAGWAGCDDRTTP